MIQGLQTVAPGIEVGRNQHNIDILQLHYSASPMKGEGKKIYVQELQRWLSPWAYNAYKSMTNPSLYLQEYEIDAEATLGQLLYQLDPEASLCQSFPIPPNWTHRMTLDPHPGIPHAFLWCATDPYGDRWYYRELWPSKVCFRYESGSLVGKPGPCPEDDYRTRISEYVSTVKWLESAENPENALGKNWLEAKAGQRFDEKIVARVIDYAARAFGIGTNDDPDEENYQQRYEKYLQTPPKASCARFTDCKKDHDAGQERVAEGLKPVQVLGNDGEYHKSSRIHIFQDKCPELVWQLKNNRRQTLTPTQVDKQDPSGQPVKVRNHMTDNLRYMEMSNPIFIRPTRVTDTYEPMYEGTSY